MQPDEQTIYVDESGRPDVLNGEGVDLVREGRTSRFFVLAAVACDDSADLGTRMTTVAKTALGDAEKDLHASEDFLGARLAVFEALRSMPVRITAIAIDKGEIPKLSLWRSDRSRLFNDMVAWLAGDLVHARRVTRLILAKSDFNRKPNIGHIGQILRQRNDSSAGRLGTVRVHEVFVKNADGRSDRGLQAADYAAYAVMQMVERGDHSLCAMLGDRLVSVWQLDDLTPHGHKPSPQVQGSLQSGKPAHS